MVIITMKMLKDTHQELCKHCQNRTFNYDCLYTKDIQISTKGLTCANFQHLPFTRTVNWDEIE